jgi:hypothetical protein
MHGIYRAGDGIHATLGFGQTPLGRGIARPGPAAASTVATAQSTKAPFLVMDRLAGALAGSLHQPAGEGKVADRRRPTSELNCGWRASRLRHGMRLFCGARTRRGGRCRQHPVRGRRRCRMHGGHSHGAGPRLIWQPGLEAAWVARRAYIERLHAQGLRHPGGRPPGRKKVLTIMAEGEKTGVAALEALPAVAREAQLSPLLVEGLEEALHLQVDTIRMVRQVLERDGEHANLKLLDLGNQTGAALCRLGMRAAENELRGRPSDALGELLAEIRAEKAAKAARGDK